jgi:hypothetical protein
MILSEVLQRFVEDSPVCVMARVALERALAPQKLNALFQRSAITQYTLELLFSTVVDVMSSVVCRVSPSVRAAYLKRPGEIGVSLKALYEKLSHIEPATSRELVRQTGAQVTAAIRQMKGECAPFLPGRRCLILDGNHLSGTEHRLEVLRETNAGALPGLALSVLDPQVMVISDIIPCERILRNARCWARRWRPSNPVTVGSLIATSVPVSSCSGWRAVRHVLLFGSTLAIWFGVPGERVAT